MAQILAVEFQDIESVQEGVSGTLAADGGTQQVEVAHAVRPAHDTLAVDGDGRRSVQSFPRRLKTRTRSPSRQQIGRQARLDEAGRTANGD